MSIDFLELLKLRLQFPWLVMPSTNPFTALPPRPKPGGFTPLPDDTDIGGFTALPDDLSRGPGGFTQLPDDTDIGGFTQLPDDTDLGGFTPLPDDTTIGEIEAAGADEEERPPPFRWREWSPSVIPVEEILGHATDPEERQRLLEQAGITDEFLEDFPTGSLPSFITDYLAGGRKIPESEEGQTNIYDLLKGDVSAGDVDVDLPEHEVRAGLGEEIPLKDAKEFDPDDFISDFLESRDIKSQQDPMQRLGDIIAENQKKLDDPEAWWNKRDTYVELDPDEAKKKAAINPYLYPESQGPSSIPELDILREQQARLEQDGRSSIPLVWAKRF